MSNHRLKSAIHTATILAKRFNSVALTEGFDLLNLIVIYLHEHCEKEEGISYPGVDLKCSHDQKCPNNSHLYLKEEMCKM